MKIRKPTDLSASWRHRFLEIAREVEAGRAPRSLVIARQSHRPRISAFSTPRVRVLHATAWR